MDGNEVECMSRQFRANEWISYSLVSGHVGNVYVMKIYVELEQIWRNQMNDDRRWSQTVCIHLTSRNID